MGQDYFQFKKFRVNQDQSAMKVTTDACLFGSWISAPRQKKLRILDIGTGTGLLALLVAQNHPLAEIDAIEIDPAACKQAHENFNQSPWTNRLHAIEGDIKSILLDKKYDIIISNPPFYEKELRGENKEKNLAHHNEGLLLTELFSFISSYLNPDGVFFLLLPFKRKEEIKQLLLFHSLHANEMLFVRPSLNHSYTRLMVRGEPNAPGIAETSIDEISIKDSDGNYTGNFINLLKDFYLNL